MMYYPHLLYFRTTCIAIILLLCIVTGAAAAFNTPMFRADPQHTGVYDNGGINPGGILVWKFTTSGGVDSSPTVTNGVVYTGSNDKNVYAFNAATGAKIWNYTTEGPVFSSPAVANGIVYIGSGEGNIQTQVYKGTVYALGAVTGTEIWHYSTGGLVSSSPVVMDGVVYIGSADDNVYALNATTGTEIWHYKTGEMFSSPAVANGVVYIGSQDGNIYALNATSGDENWRFSTGYWVTSSPSVANGIVYVGSYDHNVYALNAVTGTEIWRYATGSPVESSPAIANGIVYIGSNDHNLYALNAVTGSEIWHYSTGSLVSSSPAIANGVVYVGSFDNNVYALNAVTGTEIWHYSTGSLVSSSPAIANGIVYIGSNDKNVYAIGSSPGNTGSISFSSTPSGAQIYLGGNNSGHTTTYTLAGITAGQHAVMLKLAGYQDYNQNVTVIAGQTAIVHAALSPEGWVPITAPCVISSPGHYRLTNDLFNSSIETAILITSPDVILDGNGHSLTGGVLENTFGVLVANEGRSPVNISIYNLMTNKWGRGIHIQNSSYVKIFNCTSTENFQGLSIIGVRDCAIEQCNLSQNILDPHLFEAWGLNIINSERIEVKGNDIHSNKPFDTPYSSSGIVCTNSQVVISGNHIWDQDGAGILLGRSDQGKVTIRDNLIDNFVGTGISVDTNIDGVPVLIVNNTINAPDGTIGILTSGTDSVNITSNTISSKYRGITIINSANDILSHNTITGSLTGFALMGNGNIPYYYHSIDETNTVDGKPIRYFKDINGLFIDNSVDAATIIAINCTDGIITGQSLSKNNDGILFVGCRNMTVSNSVLNNNFYGIETYNTETCVFRDVVTSDNDFIGFASNDNSNIRLVNYTSNNNVAFGLILQNSEGFLVRNSVLNNNGEGIPDGAGISASNSRGSITNVTASENKLFGILAMSDSVISINDSRITNNHGNGLQSENSECNVNNSEIAGSENSGVTVYNEGASVQMSGCTIRDSDHAGIWFSDASGGTISIISNTLFNNTLNALIEGDNDPITWNTSKTAGTNIVNGPFLGGNYWASPDGTGWSQVTPDRGDGFCNAPFVIDANNTDYLPLHLFQGEIPITAPCVISSPGHYRLTNSLFNSTAETAIWIQSSDVVLNGDGHTLNGVSADNTTGVLSRKDGESSGTITISNITVMNLSVSAFEDGIQYNNVNAGIVSGNTFAGNARGIEFLKTSGTLVTGNNASGQVMIGPMNGVGIIIAMSNHNTFTHNTLNRNGIGGESEFGGQGINVGDNSSGNVFSDNIIHENQVCGILCEGSCNENVIANNSVRNNGNGIVLFDQCRNNEILNNHVEGNPSGIFILGSSGNRLRSNTLAGNTYNFLVSGNGREDYLQDVDTSNTVDGKVILYLTNVTGRDIGPADNPGTVYAIDCQDLRVRDLTLTKNGVGGFFWSGDHITLENVTCSQNSLGLSFPEGSKSLLLTGVHGNENDEAGIFMTGAENVVIQGSSASFNQRRGIFIDQSNDIVITNTSASHNAGEGIGKGIGIEIDSCQNVSLDQTRTSLNKHFGITFDGIDGMVIRNGVADGNEEVAIVALNSRETEVSGMGISGNEGSGFGIKGLSDSQIYNNYLNNTLNLDFDAPGAETTTWNITKTTGTNIVNGPYLGGNYWAKPDGTGWSQVTPDRGDGFCNAPFVIDANNTDYLPLHTYTKPSFYADFSVSPTSGTAPLTVTCTDKSIGNPTWLVYDFGDGTNVTGPNPSHTYRFPGVYTITLSIMKYNTTTYSVMSSTATKPNAITVNSVPVVPLVAKFAASPVTGAAPLKVSFTDQSTGSPTFLNYDFGDGINATGPNTVHTYRFPGVYNVTQSIFRFDSNSGSMLSNTSVQMDLIVVTGI